MDLDELCLAMASFLKQNALYDIDIIETESSSKLTKRVIVASAEDREIAKNVAHGFIEEFKQKTILFHKDGIIRGEWVVLDYNDIIVHIFTPKLREKYNVEKLCKASKNCIRFDDMKI